MEQEKRNASSQTVPDESAEGNDNINHKLNKCLLLLSHVNAKVDALAEMQCQQVKTLPNVKLAKINLQPVKSLADLEKLEENCREEDFIKTIIASLGRIHGRHRYTGRGATVSLQIVDYFFSRDFLLQCSWTGTGRTSGKDEIKKTKIPFMKFDKTINLFYQTVLHSDPSYTFTDCKSFLHRCLKNAKQRFAEVTGTRKPVSRKRKRLTVVEDNSSEEDENECSTTKENDNPPEETTGSTTCSPPWKVEFLELDEEFGDI